MIVKLILFSFLIINVNNSFSQQNIWGKYIDKEFTYRELELKPDFTYNYLSQGPCGTIQAYKDTGVFTVIEDTIYLFSLKNNEISTKYLLLNEKNINHFYDTLISKNKEDTIVACFWVSNSIVKINKSEKLLDKSIHGRISDYECLSGSSYIKNSEYYENGKLHFEIVQNNDFKTKIFHYSSGQIKLIENYKNDVKHGVSIYYDLNGEIEKKEYYKNGQLKKTKT